MSPTIFWSLFSFRNELKYVAGAFLLVILMPILAVLVVTQTGIEVVSDSLVDFNETHLTVQIKNPLDGKVVTEISGPFSKPTQGVTTLEFAQSSIYQVFHTGLDIAGKRGDPITPFMKGKVIYAGEISWGYGKHIIIDHGNNITSLYAHLDKILVTKDHEVKPGSVIGTQGDTGWATGTHLHFETRVFGIPVNPNVFLKL